MKPALACALVALVACKAGESDDYPVQPGGGNGIHGGGGSGSATDAGGPDAPRDAGVSGRVCLATDSRDLAGCAGSGAGGFTVTRGSASTTTGDDGAFTLASADPSTLWTVTGTLLQKSAKVATSPGEIPAITADLYTQMTTNTGSTLIGAEQGGVIARIRQAGAPLVGAAVQSQAAVSDVYYDTADDTTWQDDGSIGTGAFGDAWIPVLPIGTAQLKIIAPGTGSATLINVVVVDQAITYLDVDVP